MGNLRDFLIDVGRNAYGLGENVASLGSAAIAEPVAGYAAMFDPVNGAQAIREGMTYQPRTEAGRMYQQGAATTLGAMVKPAMPVIDAWQRGVDIAGRYSPMAGAALQTVPTALGVALGAKPTLQAGRQASNTLGAMQARMIANANAPRTLNTGFMGQRGAINPSDFNLITNPDGTVTLYHGTTNEAAKKIIQDKKLLSAGEPDVYMTTDPMAGYGDGTVVQLNIDPKHLFLDDEFPSGRVDFRMPSVKGWRIQQPKIYEKGGFMGQRGSVGNQRPLTEFEQAHLIAQRNAALPVSQGGLGLAPDNTAMDRARALGFDVDNPVYHGTKADFESFKPSKGGVFFTKQKNIADQFGNSREYVTKGKKIFNIDVGNLTKEQKDYFNKMESSIFDEDDIESMGSDYSSLADAMEYGDLYRIAGRSAQNNVLNKINKSGYDIVDMPDYHGDASDNVRVVFDPANIRLSSAAFDPMQSTSSNLLAQFGALAPTATMAAYLYNQERNKGGKQ